MRMNQRAPLLSEWATGRRFGADAPVEGEDDSVSIIPSGACGAFVSGLEDEFMGEKSFLSIKKRPKKFFYFIFSRLFKLV